MSKLAEAIANTVKAAQ
ncbi:beta-class phenol-soluble modulin, partial [Staphylococcus epidermidis]|nr:beta-class phenol-soluble modulin [Staphylococcus epidermidis]